MFIFVGGRHTKTMWLLLLLLAGYRGRAPLQLSCPLSRQVLPNTSSHLQEGPPHHCAKIMEGKNIVPKITQNKTKQNKMGDRDAR